MRMFQKTPSCTGERNSASTAWIVDLQGLMNPPPHLFLVKIPWLPLLEPLHCLPSSPEAIMQVPKLHDAMEWCGYIVATSLNMIRRNPWIIPQPTYTPTLTKADKFDTYPQAHEPPPPPHWHCWSHKSGKAYIYDFTDKIGCTDLHLDYNQGLG